VSWASVAFTRPWMGLIVLIPILWFLFRQKWTGKKSALIFSDLRLINFVGTWRTHTIFLPSAIAFLAWCSLSFALMGPRLGHEETKVTTEGVALSMVIDVSASMAEEDMIMNNQQVSRYEMVDRIFKDFVLGSEELGLPGRSNDMLSLVVFGTYVDDLCPLTLDHDFMLDLMTNKINTVRKDIQASQQAQQQGNRAYLQALNERGPIWASTAVYEGVALGADKLQQKQGGQGDYKIRSKAIILLTDGEDTAKSISVDDAISVAKEFGIKVYAIAIHGQKNLQKDLAGFFVQQATKEHNDGPLKKIAKETGGRFFQATNPQSLTQVMTAIDEMEKSEITHQISTDYAPWHRPWLLLGLILLMTSTVLRHSIYRELP
jgi:Ca-activated chloride channel family protein